METIDYSEKGIVENTELKHTAYDTVFKFKSLKKGKTKVTATVYDKSDVRNKTTVCYDAEVLPMSIRKTLRAAAVKAVKEAAPAVHAYEGRVCSGDQFISTKEQKDKITSDFGGMCCEMEGAAIAQACYLNNTPYVVIRAVSDKSDGSQAVEFSKFEAEAAVNCAKIVQYMVENL